MGCSSCYLAHCPRFRRSDASHDSGPSWFELIFQRSVKNSSMESGLSSCYQRVATLVCGCGESVCERENRERKLSRSAKAVGNIADTAV